MVLAKTCTGKLDFEPGHGWHYSNTGYMLLKHLIETVSGKPYASNIEAHIIQPLQLGQTRVTTRIDDGQLTPGYCAYLNDQQIME
ncbi:serine hydrolase domain-containing protein, partial [Acinetobacter baumannii]